MLSPEADTAWQELASGFAYRTYRDADSNGLLLQAVRIDPEQFAFRAHYHPSDPLRIHEWQNTLPEASVIVNSNFFTPEHTVLGLLVSDGVVYGAPYRDRGGIFAVENGVAHVRPTVVEPYRGELLEQAVQAFPLLVQNGEAAYRNSRDIRPSRRTIIGQDVQGQIYLMVAPGLHFSLTGLSAYLATLDIEWEHAFNLDGGGSTMMYIEPLDFTLQSFDAVPAVLAVYPKD